MANETRLEQVRGLLQDLLPELGIAGLRLEGIGFDYVRQSFSVSLARESCGVTLLLTVERVDELQSASHFAIRRFRREIETALDDA